LADIEVRRWRVNDGMRLYTLEDYGGSAVFVKFSAGGSVMAAIYRDGTVKLSQVP
jgi:hypothetical protein